MESDSQRLTEAINGTNQDMAINGNLFKEIKYFVNVNFSCCKINYCPRTCNKVADAIAKYGANLDQSCVRIWQESAPDFVNVLLASDFAVLSV